MEDNINLKKQEKKSQLLNSLEFKYMYEDVLKASAIGSQCEISPNGIESRSLFVMRHGERVDLTFGTWIPHCLDKSGKYRRNDLNMPETIPERSLGPIGYDADSPLTNLGIFQAETTGKALSNKKIDIAYAYCSPSFRCIQTCDAVLKGCGKRDDVKIKIEPGLFEWTAWYANKTLPDWMTNDELIAAGYNIDQDYKPFFSEWKLKKANETCEEFYMRNATVSKGAVNAHPTGNILLVGHASTLEVCSRELVGKKHRVESEMIKVIDVPYCALVQLTQKGDNWSFTEPPIPPFTHSTNERVDYKMFMD